MDGQDHPQSTLPTPQSSTMPHTEDSSECHAAAKDRAIFALRSIFKNSDTSDQSQAPGLAIGERQVKALVTLSGSLLSMLIRLGDNFVCEQSICDLTEFVLGVMDASANRESAQDLAECVFNFIQGSNPACDSPVVENNAALITPNEDEVMEDMAEKKAEKEAHAAPHSESLVDQHVSLREYNPPALTYDPVPIAKLGARLLVDKFGSDTCPSTVVDYTPTLSEYIADTIFTARVERPIAVYALALLARLSALTGVNVPHGTFGLFITAFMIAGKTLSDTPYTDASWYIVGQKMFTLKELIEMERLMCANLYWRLTISIDALKRFETKLYGLYGGESYAGPRLSTPISGTQAGVDDQGVILPPFSSLLEIPLNPRGGSSTPAPPQTPPSSDFGCVGVNISPKWAPPSPSAFRSPSSYQEELRSNNNQELVWVDSVPADYENEECSDDEDDEDTEDEVF